MADMHERLTVAIGAAIWDTGTEQHYLLAKGAIDAVLQELRRPDEVMKQEMCRGIDAFTLLPDEAARIWENAIDAIGEKADG